MPASVAGDVSLFALIDGEGASYARLVDRVPGIGYLDAEVDMTARSLGLGLSTSEDESSAVWQAGAGLDVFVSEQWLLELEAAYKLPTSDLDDFDFWTVGLSLQYRF